MMFILLRASIPRPRYDQVMDFSWKVLPAADPDQSAGDCRSHVVEHACNKRFSEDLTHVQRV
jgi:hypothetical protein